MNLTSLGSIHSPGGATTITQASIIDRKLVVFVSVNQSVVNELV